MVFLDWKSYPWYWSFTDHFAYAALLVVLVPGLLALVFGFFAFRSRIKGVYFSIITQALTYAFMLLFFRNDTGFGGNNGFTDFKRILGFPITAPETRVALFALTGAALLGAYLLGRFIVASKFGRVLTAIRDAESRVMFCGYNPLYYKLAIWTLSAVLCGIAGALYVPQVGIINPGEMSPANSIEIAIWVAVGGRGIARGRDRRRVPRQRRQELVHAGVSGVLAVLPRPAVHPGHALPAARRRRPAAGEAAMSADGPPRGRTPERAARRYPVNTAAHTTDAGAPGLAQLGMRIAGAGVDASHGPILYLDGISVSFDGFRALNNLSLTVEDGELRCIIGPNGAGKTTMMDVITGKTRPDAGTAFFGQTIDLTKLTEPQIAHAGIGRKFQKPTVFEELTVFENLELAMKADKRVRGTLRARLGSADRDRIAETLALIHLPGEAQRAAGLLSHGQKQWLEIGMLLMQEPRLILLDEPVAGMTDEESMRTAELCLTLAGRHSVVVVEHDMEFIGRIARKVTVLHEGSVLAEGPMDVVQADPRVIEVYLGR